VDGRVDPSCKRLAFHAIHFMPWESLDLQCPHPQGQLRMPSITSGVVMQPAVLRLGKNIWKILENFGDSFHMLSRFWLQACSWCYNWQYPVGTSQNPQRLYFIIVFPSVA
jgi:hypothetical protein